MEIQFKKHGFYRIDFGESFLLLLERRRTYMKKKTILCMVLLCCTILPVMARGPKFYYDYSRGYKGEGLHCLKTKQHRYTTKLFYERYLITMSVKCKKNLVGLEVETI